MASLSREEEAELARSNKKAKDVNHAGFSNGKGMGIPQPEQVHEFRPPSSPPSFKDKLVGEILGAYTQAFNFAELMDDDAESDEDVGKLRQGLAAVKFTKEFKQHIRSWEPYFKPSTANVSSVAVWIRLNELPIEFYNAEALFHIGKAIGNVLRVDTHTASETRGRFACLCVQVDVDKPLINTVLIGRFEQTVTYEGIHRMCFSCGRMGHRRESCPYTIRNGNDQVDKDEGDSVDRSGQPCNSHVPDNPVRSSGTTPKALEDNYGPWLLVSRKKTGTKGRGRNVPDAGRSHAQGQEGVDAHAPGAKATTDRAPKSGSRFSLRERKRKLSPTKSPMAYIRKEGTQGGATGTSVLAQVPLHSGLLDSYHPGLGEGPMSFKVNSSVSIKGKKVMARARAHQTSFRILESSISTRDIAIYL
nr:uncharacterized protein CFP56_20045 [Quercus suber]